MQSCYTSVRGNFPRFQRSEVPKKVPSIEERKLIGHRDAIELFWQHNVVIMIAYVSFDLRSKVIDLLISLLHRIPVFRYRILVPLGKLNLTRTTRFAITIPQ
jgi:hypothetical protein